MDINWDEAPEGFDYALTTDSDWNGAPEYKGTIRFAKKRENSAYFECREGRYPLVGRGCWVVVATRPKQWNGEGLPPVGTVCEAWHLGCEQGVVEIRYSGECMVLWSVSRKHEQCSASENYTFKVLRTPEQIAAEEREKAITELAAELAGHWSAEAVATQRDMAAYLYDAGYRRIIDAKD